MRVVLLSRTKIEVKNHVMNEFRTGYLSFPQPYILVGYVKKKNSSLRKNLFVAFFSEYLGCVSKTEL